MMIEQKYRWKNKEIREQASVLDGIKEPTLLLTNATFLHSILRMWMTANIWIYKDRIVYIGEKLPQSTTNCEVVDCTGYKLVPGYIEPHAHPFHIYNPVAFANFAGQTGTTTLVNDNLALFLQNNQEKAFSFMKELNELPVSTYWWTRFDSTTELKYESEIFSSGNIQAWLEHSRVVQGGELTAWSQLLDGDDLLLYWVQEAKRLGKKVEGHFQHASDMTLAKMKLFGADSDHQALSGEDVYQRLLHGYSVLIQHSSLYAQLPKILQEMNELGIQQYDKIMLTTDGSSPAFYKDGLSDRLIKITLENGVPAIDAYHMVSYNVANHFNLLAHHGMIATGRIAHINFLEDEMNPTPVSVLAKGQWMKKEGKMIETKSTIEWGKYGLSPLKKTWELQSSDWQFSIPIGIEMTGEFETKPYQVKLDASREEIPEDVDEHYFVYFDRKGKWKVNTLIKGFAKQLDGFASSFSSSGDFFVIGKSKQDMKLAFEKMRESGGGVVLVEKGEVIFDMPLTIGGFMSDEELPELFVIDETCRQLLKDRGFNYGDPFITLLFLTATYLPYFRITQKGMYDVKNKNILLPALMR